MRGCHRGDAGCEWSSVLLTHAAPSHGLVARSACAALRPDAWLAGNVGRVGKPDTVHECSGSDAGGDGATGAGYRCQPPSLRLLRRRRVMCARKLFELRLEGRARDLAEMGVRDPPIRRDEKRRRHAEGAEMTRERLAEIDGDELRVKRLHLQKLAD